MERKEGFSDTIPGLDMYSKRCMLAQEYIRLTLQKPCSTVKSEDKRPPLDFITNLCVNIEFFLTINVEVIQNYEELNEGLDRRNNRIHGNLLSEIFRFFDQEMIASTTGDQYLNLYSTSLIRISIAVVLYILSGKRISTFTSSEINVFQSSCAKAKTLVWTSNWSHGNLPINISELHQISNDITNHQANLLYSFIKKMSDNNIDDITIKNMVIEFRPPSWIKDEMLKSARTPVLIQAFEPIKRS
jgi:hypothetical protein